MTVHTWLRNIEILQPSMMRVLRSYCRLRFLVMMVVVAITFYMIGQLHTSQELDQMALKRASLQLQQQPHPGGGAGMQSRNVRANYVYEDTELVTYKKDTPLIWVGGVPRSGTTLMRVMLDAHKDIRCGEETRVIPRVLSMHVGMTKSEKEMSRLKEAKITEEVLDHALAAYILSIISEHGEWAPRLCNKDPFTLKSMDKIIDMFPQSKFLFMVRDGRATVHSIISRHVTIKGFDINSYRGGLQDWNRAVETMYNECMKVGENYCLPVYYEQLVLHPRGQMERILTFLGAEWDEMVIHHELTINKTGGTSLSGKELSTDQVIRPVNTEALTSWVPFIPPDVRNDMAKIAPMLEKLGYDPHGYPPNYGEPDKLVQETDTKLKLQDEFYQERRPKNQKDGLPDKNRPVQPLKPHMEGPGQPLKPHMEGPGQPMDQPWAGRQKPIGF